MKTNMDLIDRQAAIAAVSNWLYDRDDGRSVDQLLSTLPSAQPERPFEIQDILDYLDTVLHPIISPEHWNVYSELHDMISTLPSAQPQPEEDCDTCKHGYFGDRQCDNCRVRYPSHYEREEEQRGSD